MAAALWVSGFHSSGPLAACPELSAKSQTSEVNSAIQLWPAHALRVLKMSIADIGRHTDSPLLGQVTEFGAYAIVGYCQSSPTRLMTVAA